MPGAARAAFRIPVALGVVLQIPAVIAAGALFLGESIRLIYGSSDDFLGMWMVYAAAPAALVDAFTLAGRIVWVDDLPDPRRRDAPAAAVLSLPGTAEAGVLRPAEVPPAPVRALREGRRSLDGVLSVAGVAQLLACIVLAVVEQDSFDSVFGIKLGGIRFYGEYWNRWWFVLYGLMASGGATLTVALGLFLRRLNRGAE